GVAILEQAVELAAVAAEFGALVEDLSERLLDGEDVVANSDSAAELLLDVGRSREMVGMGMGLDQPLQLQAVGPDIVDQNVGGLVADATGRIIDVHHGIDDPAGCGLRVAHHIADGAGVRIEKACHLRHDAAVDGIGHSLLQFCHCGCQSPRPTVLTQRYMAAAPAVAISGRITMASQLIIATCQNRPGCACKPGSPAARLNGSVASWRFDAEA